MQINCRVTKTLNRLPTILCHRTYTYYLVPRIAGTALAAEDRTLNTWRIASKPAYY
jgi:hypothetical protein